jgi:hypothetical protein
MTQATILKSEQRTARKTYRCDATALFHRACMGRHDLSPDQQAILDATEANGGRILPGQTYHYSRGLHEGSRFTWRALPDMERVCQAHGLFDD